MSYKKEFNLLETKWIDNTIQRIKSRNIRLFQDDAGCINRSSNQSIIDYTLFCIEEKGLIGKDLIVINSALL